MLNPDLELLIRDVGRFSVGLVGLDDLRQASTSLAGSATLVTARGNNYVLTAHHVAEVLARHKLMGLVAGYENMEKNYFVTLPTNILDVAAKARGIRDCDGPDICAIPIDPGATGTIKAGAKEFYTYDPAGPTPDPECIAVLVGLPEAYATYGKTSTLGHAAFVLQAGIHEFARDDWDYAETSVYVGDGTLAPDSFGGVSGGGLWLVKLDDAGRPSGRLLHGVAFCELPQVGETGRKELRVRCHGPASVRKVLLGHAT